MVVQAVEAALSQTRGPSEIVVSDDASPDDTVAALSRISAQDPRVKVISQLKNSGGVPNWNSVIGAATGEFIAWCSDDDRFLPDHLEASVGFLEQNTEVDMVHSGFLNFLEGSKNVESLQEVTGKSEKCAFKSDRITRLHGVGIMRYMIKHYTWPFHPSTLVFRRSFWLKVGLFDPTYQLADTDWFVRAAFEGIIAYIPRYSVINRRHRDNWSNRVGSIRMQQEVNAIMTKAIVRASGVSGSARFATAMARWQWSSQYQFMLARLFVARSRAGMPEIAIEAADEMLRSFWVFRSVISRAIWRSAAERVGRCLAWLQIHAFGGMAKYNHVGEFTPK